MNLLGIWTLYDNEELLTGSINQIKDHLDGVLVTYQTVSNYGNPYDGYANWNKTDHVALEYIPKTGDSHVNQKRKLSLALRYARNAGYTHYIYLAPDEYYDTDEFEKCKEVAKDYDSTACSLYTYFKYPTCRLTPKENYYVPFINRILPGQQFNQRQYPVLVDPSRCLVPCGKFFLLPDLNMHHYSWIRNNIKRKLVNHSLAKRYDIVALTNEFNQWNRSKPIPFFKDFSIEKVPNYFDI